MATRCTGFVYSKIDNYNFYYKYRDLYFYDLRTRKSKRLTEGARAHHACFSPDGKNLYYIQNLPGKKQISVIDLKAKKAQVLYTSPLGDNIENLACPSKNFILYVEQKPDQDPHIARIDLVNKTHSIFFNEVPGELFEVTNKGLLFLRKPVVLKTCI